MHSAGIRPTLWLTLKLEGCEKATVALAAWSRLFVVIREVPGVASVDAHQMRLPSGGTRARQQVDRHIAPPDRRIVLSRCQAYVLIGCRLFLADAWNRERVLRLTSLYLSSPLRDR